MSARWRWDEPADVARVLEELRHDGVVVLPTDTLYGFSGRARSPGVVARILALKGIDTARGFVALVDSAAAIRRDAAPGTDPRVFALLERAGPAPLSVIVRVREPQAWGEVRAAARPGAAAPGTVSPPAVPPGTAPAGNAAPELEPLFTAAYRVPAHPQLRALLAQLGEPLVSTSVNRTGQPPLGTAAAILAEFGSGIAGCVEDPACETGPRPASTLADCTAWPPVVLRPGAFDLAGALGALEGESAARPMGEKRRQVLFVCTGNTCRSPLAAALARAWCERQGIQADVVSAGIAALDDAPASDGAQAVAAEAGLSLSAHQAQLLTRSQVRAADLVLTMGERHREFIRVLAPEVASRVHPLRDYASGGTDAGDLADPFGGDRTVYRRTLRELQPLVERALQRWTQEGAGGGP